VATVDLRFAYNTNGLAHHRLDDALRLLADTGYDGVAITLDVQHLDPFGPDPLREAERVRAVCDALGLGVVVETGARFLLDPRRKHHPTLVSDTAEERAVRLDFLRRCCTLAEVLQAEAVSFWSGATAAPPELSWGWLRDGVLALAEGLGSKEFALSLEPEPGMLVGDCAAWERLSAEVPGLRLALDAGHCLVEGDLLPEDAVRRYRASLGTVAVEGMRRGVHEHLPLEEGDLDLPAVLSALGDWAGLVTVELSRESHRADVMVPRALATLRAAGT
jgi:sugar phosphate isomerase/epimerase